MTTVWEPLQYGWSVIYYVTIEGIPTVWIESATGLSLPSGYTTESESLVIDKSAAIGATVDRDSGLGAGLPLSFHLQDTAHLRTWLQAPDNRATLTADLGAADADLTITTADSTGWPASGTIYAGLETINYASHAGGVFTVSAAANRGIVGYKYAHDSGPTSARIADKPRWWRGREVKLWARPVDPSGYTPGAALATDAELLWRGHIDRGPVREGNLFAFDALAIDRRLARPLGASLTGVIIDTDARFAVYKKMSISLRIVGTGGAGFDHDLEFQPFKDDADGDILSSSEIQQRIADGYAQAVIDFGATAALDTLSFVSMNQPLWTPGDGDVVNIWMAAFTFDADADLETIVIFGTIFGQQKISVGMHVKGATASAFTIWDNWWNFGHNPLVIGIAGFGFSEGGGATVKLDDAAPADVPTGGGRVRVGDAVYEYASAETTQGNVYLAGLTAEATDGEQPALVKQRCEILLSFSDSPADVVRRILASSGTGERNATYDDLDEMQGYGLDEDMIDDTGIGDELGAGFLGQMELSVTYRGESLRDSVGGLLALSQHAMVARQIRGETNRKVQITVVDTSSAGSDWIEAITDADLITSGGQPVRALDPGARPNIIRVEAVTGGKTVHIHESRDQQQVLAQGAVKREWTIPAPVAGSIAVPVSRWARSRFAADQVVQLLELQVVPWAIGEADVGDMLSIDISHYSVWQWSDGTPGYTGLGRIIGLQRSLGTGAVTVTLLIDGVDSARGLCPSAAVSAFAGTAGNPTTIDVNARYFNVMTKALAILNPFRLLHYERGQTEGVSEGYNISAVTDTAGVCRLTVDSLVGAPSLVVGDSHLTWPESANDSTYQDDFMHDADGSVWG